MLLLSWGVCRQAVKSRYGERRYWQRFWGKSSLALNKGGPVEDIFKILFSAPWGHFYGIFYIPGLWLCSLVSVIPSLAPRRVVSTSHRILAEDNTDNTEMDGIPRTALCCKKGCFRRSKSLEEYVRIRAQRERDDGKYVPCTKNKAHHGVVI